MKAKKINKIDYRSIPIRYRETIKRMEACPELLHNFNAMCSFIANYFGHNEKGPFDIWPHYEIRFDMQREQPSEGSRIMLGTISCNPSTHGVFYDESEEG